MKLKLTPEIYSRRQLADCLEELDSLFEYAKEQEFRQRTTKLSEAKDKFQLPTLTGQLKSLLGANRELWQSEGLGAVRQAVKRHLEQAPKFEIYLPTQASDSFLSELAQWFRSQVNPGALLDIKIRQTLSGGFMLRTKNHMYDFSFRKKLRDRDGALQRALTKVNQ